MRHIRKDIGDRVKERMNELGLKQKDLVSISGLSKSTVSKIVNGETNPSAEILLSLSESLHVTVDWIVKGDTNEAFKQEQKLFHSSWDLTELNLKLSQSEKEFILEYVNFSIARKN
ncbi:helix-turn-helix domain-containing protein [Cytobacillus sp. Hz8]|uniref:helix-turn-helix domain-containing protein n=1 Tax=Cytobacillus sp. Hz8 TaxID=3347168 RepID=UPI0035E0A10F